MKTVYDDLGEVQPDGFSPRRRLLDFDQTLRAIDRNPCARGELIERDVIDTRDFGDDAAHGGDGFAFGVDDGERRNTVHLQPIERV